MSKSPNIFLPALGLTTLVLGVAFGVSTRSYKAEETALAQAKAQAAQARVADATTQTEKLQARIEAIQADAAAKLAELDARPKGVAISAAVPDIDAPLGLGRAAHADEIAAWDVDVLPDGRGLPVGSGDVLTGEEVFADKCAACHGDFAEGVDNWPVLAGGFDTLADKDPVKTVGSYWPYMSTIWDYVNRSMPFGEAQTLSVDETYAITAYILYSNDLVGEDFVLNRDTFLDVEMPNTSGFVVDDRAELEYSAWRTEPCMDACKDSVDITKRATTLNVTPLDSFMHPAMHGGMEVEPLAVETATAGTPEAGTATDLDPELVAAGERAFRRCKSCHQVGNGAKNRTGPHLNGLLGRTIGAVDGFDYSGVFVDAEAQGEVWGPQNLGAFLTNPKRAMAGTKMNFSGLRKEADIAAILAYLKASGG